MTLNILVWSLLWCSFLIYKCIRRLYRSKEITEAFYKATFPSRGERNPSFPETLILPISSPWEYLKLWKLPKLSFIFVPPTPSPSVQSPVELLMGVCAKSLQLCSTLCNTMDCSPPGSSVCGILQARILEWIAMSTSRESSQFRNCTHACCIFCIAAEPPGKSIWLNFYLSYKGIVLAKIYGNTKAYTIPTSIFFKTRN